MLSNGENKTSELKEDKTEGSEKSFGSTTEKSESNVQNMFSESVSRNTGKGARQEGQRNLQDSTFSISCK